VIEAVAECDAPTAFGYRRPPAKPRRGRLPGERMSTVGHPDEVLCLFDQLDDGGL
jgi:hypothetical protein